MLFSRLLAAFAPPGRGGNQYYTITMILQIETQYLISYCLLYNKDNIIVIMQILSILMCIVLHTVCILEAINHVTIL